MTDTSKPTARDGTALHCLKVVDRGPHNIISHVWTGVAQTVQIRSASRSRSAWPRRSTLQWILAPIPCLGPQQLTPIPTSFCSASQRVLSVSCKKTWRSRQISGSGPSTAPCRMITGSTLTITCHRWQKSMTLCRELPVARRTAQQDMPSRSSPTVRLPHLRRKNYPNLLTYTTPNSLYLSRRRLEE